MGGPPGDGSPEAAGAIEPASRRQVRGSGLLLAGQAFAVAVNIGIQVIIVRYLSKDDFGAFAYVLAVVGVAQVFAAFGLRHAVSRYMPMHEERGDPARAAGAFVFALGMVLALGTCLVGGVIALREVIGGGIGTEDAVALLAIMIVLAPLFAFGTVLDGAFAVFGRPRAIVLRRFVLVPILRLAVVGALVFGNYGVIFLAWGYVGVELIGIAAYAPMLIPLLRRRGLLAHMRPGGGIELPAREMLGFAAPLFTSDIAGAVLNFAGAIVVGAAVGAQEVASLRAVFPIVLTMSYVLTSFGTLFVPLASRLHARGAAAELSRLYWSTTTWTMLLAYPIFATSVILAEPLTEALFGARYESSATVLAVLALGLFANTAAGHNGVLLGIFGQVRLVALTSLATILVNLALTLALVPAHGALGAAIAITVAYVTMNGLRQIGLARRTAIAAFDAGYLRVLGAALGTTAAALAIELALSPPLAFGVALTVVACVLVAASARGELHLLETFPELSRVPLFAAFARAKG